MSMKMKFNIPKQQKIPTPEEGYNNLVGATPDEKIMQIEISLLDEVEQPFSVNEEKVEDIAKSIAKVGQQDPVIVRKQDNGRYEILAGRHRVRACKLLDYNKVSCVVRDVDDLTARAILLATNTDRNNEYKPSELAKAYVEYEALLKQLNNKTSVSTQLVEKFKTDRKQIYRYKRLNSLVPQLLDMVDNKKIPLLAGVSLSYIDTAAQKKLATYLSRNNRNVTVQEAERLKVLEPSQFYFESLDEFFNPPKPQQEPIQPTEAIQLPEPMTADIPSEPQLAPLYEKAPKAEKKRDELISEGLPIFKPATEPKEEQLPEPAEQLMGDKPQHKERHKKISDDISDEQFYKKLVSLSEEEKEKIIDMGIFNDYIRGYMLLAADNVMTKKYDTVIDLLNDVSAEKAYDKYLIT